MFCFEETLILWKHNTGSCMGTRINSFHAGLGPLARILKAVVLAVFAGGLSVACIQEEPGVAKDLQVGDLLPDFTVRMDDGRVVTGAELREQPSCVVFFHTGCPDCQQALPLLQRIHDQYGENLAMVLIGREQPAEEVRAYWQENGYTMPFSPQETREIFEMFAQERVPRIYLSPIGGHIAAIFTDNPVPDYETLLTAVMALNL